jgi:hypothetical protein
MKRAVARDDSVSMAGARRSKSDAPARSLDRHAFLCSSVGQKHQQRRCQNPRTRPGRTAKVHPRLTWSFSSVAMLKCADPAKMQDCATALLARWHSTDSSLCRNPLPCSKLGQAKVLRPRRVEDHRMHEPLMESWKPTTQALFMLCR